jgi:hypothetical protein
LTIEQRGWESILTWEQQALGRHGFKAIESVNLFDLDPLNFEATEEPRQVFHHSSKGVEPAIEHHQWVFDNDGVLSNGCKRIVPHA